ncbi:MAG: PPOX class F420-dependent oxidoreductase [Actinomycetota bacterium]
MSISIPDDYHDLLEAPNTAILTTLLADGSPNGSPVWFWFDGQAISISTRAERAKHRSVLRDPRVSFTVVDPEKPLRYLEVRGMVTVEADPGYEVRDRVAAKHGYDGAAFDPPEVERVTFVIVPTRIIEH